MTNSYTTHTVNSYSSRVKNSFITSITGFFMFLASFIVLFANEGNSIREHKKLDFALKNFISIENDKIIEENNNKLIHIAGLASTKEFLKDDVFSIDVNALSLKRNVHMYQWQEEKKEKKEVKTGGDEYVTTTYTYNPIWSPKEINSANFNQPSYQNPSFPIFSYEKFAEEVNIGEFYPNTEIIKKLNDFNELDISQNNKLPNGYSISENAFYKGEDINQPQIGDLLIEFEYIPLQEISIMGEQKDSIITSYETKYGNISLVRTGNLSAEQIIEDEMNTNQIFTWVVRLVGFLLMFAGLRMSISFFGVILSILPFLQPTFAFMTTPIIFLISLTLSLSTIAIAWLFYRPIISIAIFVSIFFIRKKIKKDKLKRKQKIEAEIALKNEGKLSGVAQIIENTYTEYEEKATKTKDKILNIIDKL